MEKVRASFVERKKCSSNFLLISKNFVGLGFGGQKKMLKPVGTI
jgi:hypothetical protein